MSDTTKITVDGARFLERAVTRQDASQTGQFRLAEVVSAEDLADVTRTLELLGFLRAAGPTFGMKVGEAADIDTALEVLAAIVGQLTDPALNWVEHAEEESCQ